MCCVMNAKKSETILNFWGAWHFHHFVTKKALKQSVVLLSTLNANPHLCLIVVINKYMFIIYRITA